MTAPGATSGRAGGPALPAGPHARSTRALHGALTAALLPGALAIVPVGLALAAGLSGLTRPAAAASPPGWVEVGPERGHVMDIALSGRSVLALTRVGVLATGTDLGRWHRDPRFPAALKLIAAEPGAAGVWGVTRAGVWRVEKSAVLVAPLPRGAAVDIVSPAPAVAVIALRGEQKGVWRVTATDKTPVQTLADVDPWQLAVDGATIWLATLDHGLFVSRDGGKSFASDPKQASGTVSAVAVLDGVVWAGWSDGRVTKGEDGQLVCTVKAGPPVAIAKVAGRILTVVDAPTGPLTDLYACDAGAEAPGEAVMVPSPRVDDDPTDIQPTSLWSLDAGRAILGTFRSGPLLVDAKGLKAARDGFRATLGAAAKPGPDGRLGVALMSTGVYVTLDDAKTWEPIAPRGQPGPVTDTMDLLYTGDRVLVNDFEGITIGRADRWYRTPGTYAEGGGRNNALLEIADDKDGRLWGRDFQGHLWQQDGSAWTQCATSDVLRLDGQGDHLVVVTPAGFFQVPDVAAPGCAGAATPIWPELSGAAKAHPAATRSDGHWLAAPGGLWLDGKAVATLPEDDVQALGVGALPTGAADAPGASGSGATNVLVAQRTGELFECTASACVKVARPLPGPVVAVGYLGDGRMWALEERGSVLVSDPRAASPGPVVDTTVVEAVVSAPTRGANLGGETVEEQQRIPPWRSVGRPDFHESVGSLGSAALPTGRPGTGGPTPATVASGAGGSQAPATGPLGLPPFSDTLFWRAVEGGALVALAGGVAFTTMRGGGGRRGRRRGR